MESSPPCCDIEQCGYEHGNPVTLDIRPNTSCITYDAGVMRCWGAGFAGQLGNGEFPLVSRPVQVADVCDARSLYVGGSVTCTLRSSGQVACWGDNAEYGFGTGSNEAMLSAVPLAIEPIEDAVALGPQCAILSSGKALCWGANVFGRDGLLLWPTPQEVVSEPVVSIARAATHNCLALASGEALCWGQNKQGQLGNGSTEATETPTLVEDLSEVKKVAAGDRTSCAIYGDDGRVACWGTNTQGELGNGEFNKSVVTDMQPLPLTIEGFDGVVDLDCDSVSTYCAVRDDGTVWCWGNKAAINEDGWREDAAVPTQIPGIDQAIAVAVGAGVRCALQENGDVLCWGDNQYREAGVPVPGVDYVPFPTPVEFDPAAWLDDPKLQ